MLQRTLNKSFTLEGKGLHTGLDLKITFNPASENEGYKIRRTDISGKPIIEALAENVSGTQRGTVLSGKGFSVSTIEHALAALYACSIDNCLIEINGPEFPILDGSSIHYIRKIKEIGICNQLEKRQYISFKRKRVLVKDPETGASMLLLPNEKLTVSADIYFDSPLLNHQSAVLDDLSDFCREIASARTFVFVREINELFENNLIKGGDLDNAIVIYDKPIPQEKLDKLADLMNIEKRSFKSLGYIMNKPLRYENEPARHKILDILGDLALCGGFVKGKIIAKCPGHKINTLFARKIRECSLKQAKA